MGRYPKNEIAAAALYQSESKSSGIAYLLWLFLGGVGGHHFYIGYPITGLFYLALFVLGWLTVWFGIGLLFFFILTLGLIWDLFRIPSYVRNVNKKSAKAYGLLQ